MARAKPELRPCRIGVGSGRSAFLEKPLHECLMDHYRYLISVAKVDPLMDPICGDPRFKTWLRRLNLAK